MANDPHGAYGVQGVSSSREGSSGERTPVTLEVNIGGMIYSASFDALIDAQEDYTVQTPNFPIDDDFDTSLSTVNKQLTINLNLFLTETPVTWTSYFGERNIEIVKERLKMLFFEHLPVRIITKDETYTNMAIKAMSFKRSTEIGFAYEVSLDCVQVRIPSVSIAHNLTIKDPAETLLEQKLAEQEEKVTEIMGRADGRIIPPIVDNYDEPIETADVQIDSNPAYAWTDTNAYDPFDPFSWIRSGT